MNRAFNVITKKMSGPSVEVCQHDRIVVVENDLMTEGATVHWWCTLVDGQHQRGTKGYKYRFREINAEFLNGPIEMSVDGHNITVIASDGYELEPITATSLVTYAGARYDFVLEANNGIDKYWTRFRELMDCDERFDAELLLYGV